MLPLARLSSSITTQCAWYPIARPPYSSLAVMPRKPASPNFCHRSLGNAFSRSVLAATSSGISRRAKSCTLSRSSSRSDCEGGVKLAGCLVEACRMLVRAATRGAWRRERVSRRGARAAIVSVFVCMEGEESVREERKCASAWRGRCERRTAAQALSRGDLELWGCTDGEGGKAALERTARSGC